MKDHLTRKIHLVRFWLLVAMSVVMSLTVSAQLGAPQKVLPPSWTRSHDYDVQHYRIQVRFDWASKMIIGDTTVTLRPFLNDFKEVELDAGEMTIKSVKLASGKTLDYKYESKEKLRIMLDRPYRSGQDLSVNIAYSAKPRRGLTFITPDEYDPSRPYQIWSQGQAQNNHYW